MKSTLRLQLAAVGFIWQMLEKRGEACEMDKMWVTRELTLFFCCRCSMWPFDIYVKTPKSFFEFESLTALRFWTSHVVFKLV